LDRRLGGPKSWSGHYLTHSIEALVYSYNNNNDNNNNNKWKAYLQRMEHTAFHYRHININHPENET
jgi:hypothetical protein